MSTMLTRPQIRSLHLKMLEMQCNVGTKEWSTMPNSNRPSQLHSSEACNFEVSVLPSTECDLVKGQSMVQVSRSQPKARRCVLVVATSLGKAWQSPHSDYSNH